ncbi:hypothetical protein C5167_049465 [Papaver somniferum]|uniref:Myb/SANT-like domain-containing protein n=1 Tax=Papaver somniferum TaxID=3469 RepID=A0A4Y7KNS8_PAPSO|nr:hypothetical protein C5167_049465 [Papaver somniferum]
MDTEIATNIDRARTKWTPTMDRYFIDIMLEQVHGGNKIHNSFRKKAWVEMVTAFNEKAGLQLGKEVLRNRSKKLRMQYSAVKVLLDQDGFQWDQTRNMVTADSDVWDTYLKVHPEAQTFKTKSILNFDDLRVIYGNETAYGRNNALSNHPCLIDNIPAMETDGVSGGVLSPTTMSMLNEGNVVRYSQLGEDSVTPVSTDRSRTTWTPTMDRYFIGIMVDQLHPEARSYRTKTLPNFSNLGVVYGCEPATGRLNQLDQIHDSKDQELKNEIGPGSSHSPATSSVHEDLCMASQIIAVETPLSTDRSKTNWTPPMDNFFIEIMIEHVNKGYKIGKTFHREAWLYMLELFNNKFGLQLDKEVLKNRYKKLRTQYNAINVLLDNGLQWDEARQLVTADDSVWDDYLQEHPEARSYRTKTVPNYNSLRVIYGDSIPDTKYGGAGHHDNSKSVQIQVCGTPEYPLISSPCEDVAVDYMQEGSSDSDEGLNIIIGGSSKRRFETPSTSQVSREAQRSDRMCMLDAVHKMSVAVSRLTKKNENCVSLEIVRNALQATPDLEEDLLMDATELLQDEQKAKVFLALDDVTIRKKWLLRKLRP